MRRIRRDALEEGGRKSLEKGQASVAEAIERREIGFEKYWTAARKTKGMKTVLHTLHVMAGSRERCMYCMDSHGADIEHFWPKAGFPERIFVWENLLLNCTECGRLKGNRFPLAGAEPLLLDPTQDEPWEHLDFDPQTGNLTGRWVLASKGVSPRGQATVNHLSLDRREALSVGHLKNWCRIRECIERYLANPNNDPVKFVDEVFDMDDYGLLDWALRWTPTIVPPFTELQKSFPETWELCQARSGGR